MERIVEYARKSGLTEEEIYSDDAKYALAVEYARECLDKSLRWSANDIAPDVR